MISRRGKRKLNYSKRNENRLRESWHSVRRMKMMIMPISSKKQRNNNSKDNMPLIFTQSMKMVINEHKRILPDQPIVGLSILLLTLSNHITWSINYRIIYTSN